MLKRIFGKLKDDAPYSLIMDIIKPLFMAAVGALGVKLLSYWKVFSVTLNRGHVLLNYQLGIIIIASVGISTAITFYILNRKVLALKKDSMQDDLTGAINGEKFLIRILKENIEWAKKENKLLSIIFLDLDNFRSINNNYGTDKADKVLKEIGANLKDDIRKDDMLFRKYSKGDEFIIVTKNTDEMNARRAAESKRTRLFDQQTYQVGNTTLKITVSGGIAQYTDPDSVEQWIAKAHEALREAKKAKNMTLRFTDIPKSNTSVAQVVN